MLGLSLILSDDIFGFQPERCHSQPSFLLGEPKQRYSNSPNVFKLIATSGAALFLLKARNKTIRQP